MRSGLLGVHDAAALGLCALPRLALLLLALLVGADARVVGVEAPLGERAAPRLPCPAHLDGAFDGGVANGRVFHAHAVCLRNEQ
jgi:hypothetical protein